MKSHQALVNLSNAQKLCLGHYDIKAASEAVSKIYEKCRINETVFNKKLKKSRIPLYFENAEYFDICSFICKSFLIRPIKKLVFRSPDVLDTSYGHYINNEIHFKYINCDIISLLHELTHHVCRCDRKNDDHGPYFIEFENLVFEAFEEYWKTKTLDKTA